MRIRRARSVVVLVSVAVASLSAACSGDDAGPEPDESAQRWEYAQLYSIAWTFLDTPEPGLSRPDGLDATGIELWDRYRDAAATVAGNVSEDEAQVAALVEATRALFTHLYASGLAEAMVGRRIADDPAIVVESDDLPFEAGRPLAIGELEAVLRRDGCDGIQDEYAEWLGQTTVDEIAGRAGVFARYALDRAATAGCDWALTELVEQALGISGLD